MKILFFISKMKAKIFYSNLIIQFLIHIQKMIMFLPEIISTELVLGFEVVEDASDPGGLLRPQHFSAMC